MEKFKVAFEQLPWQPALPGARFKAFREGNTQLRLLELTPEFVEPDWCEKGHVGIMLAGELEIDFKGRVLNYPQGCALIIPAGAAHKARAMSPTALLFLVEELT